MVRRVHVQHEFAGAFTGVLRASLPDAEIVALTSEAEFLAALPEVEVLLAFRPPRGQWSRAGRLRLLQMTGAGVDSLLPAPDLPPGVRIANARGIHGTHMGEFALAMILAFAKRIPTWLEQKERREWRLHGVTLLHGRTLGILGLGSIGSELARMASALGLRVIGTRRTRSPAPGVAEVLPPEETGRVLRESDFLAVLLPLTPDTRNLLDAKRLALLPKHAVLVNLARGGIVDEAALAAALREGRLRGAALDVFAEEPLPTTSPLWDAPNLIVTPHISGGFAGYAEKIVEILVENLGRLERGEPLRNEVDRERGY